MTEFNANANPTVAVEDAYRLYVDVKDSGTSPILELQGRGVTAYSQSSNSDVSQDLDVLGYTDTTAGAPKVTQEISPLRVRKGSKLAGMIFDAYLNNKSSITVDIYEKYPMVDYSSSDTDDCKARKQANCTIVWTEATIEAGGKFGYNVTLYHSGEITLGKMAKVDAESGAAFTPDGE